MDFNGCFTALITPFENGQVSFTKLRELVNEQIAAGVDGIVPVGTTGESPTLSIAEHERVVEVVVEAANGRCRIIAGTGGNSTAEALELTHQAKSVGVDATLQVTPYYNKPTQEGLFRHFSKVADDVGLPVVLYNIPGRSVVEIAIPTVARLADNPMIVAVKEAGGTSDRVSQTLNACNIAVLSGDDSLTLPMMAVGASGVISVASNIVPAEVTRMTHLVLDGDFASAKELHYRLYDLFDALFIETSPIPIKAAMAIAGRIEEEYRLPLCPMSEANRPILIAAMRKAGIAF
jgi:4-hydroxy-tetrahydrodipicolinate synthase